MPPEVIEVWYEYINQLCPLGISWRRRSLLEKSRSAGITSSILSICETGRAKSISFRIGSYMISSVVSDDDDCMGGGDSLAKAQNIIFHVTRPLLNALQFASSVSRSLAF